MSVQNDLLTAAQSTVTNLGFVWGSGSTVVPVVVKEVQAARDVLEPATPIIVIALSPEGEGCENAATGGYVDIVYKLDFGVIAPGNGDLSSNTPTYLDWRQQLRRSFHRWSSSDVLSVWFVAVKPGLPFDQQTPTDNYDYSLLSVHFTSFEQASN